MARKHTPRKLRYARAMRKRPTRGEQALWALLQGGRLGAPFQRQIVLLGWIVDCYCARAKLAIEVDGSSHLREGAAQYDAHRSNVLWERLGVQVLRFTNEEVLEHPAGVEAKIRRLLLARGLT